MRHPIRVEHSVRLWLVFPCSLLRLLLLIQMTFLHSTAIILSTNTIPCSSPPFAALRRHRRGLSMLHHKGGTLYEEFESDDQDTMVSSFTDADSCSTVSVESEACRNRSPPHFAPPSRKNILCEHSTSPPIGSSDKNVSVKVQWALQHSPSGEVVRTSCIELKGLLAESNAARCIGNRRRDLSMRLGIGRSLLRLCIEMTPDSHLGQRVAETRRKLLLSLSRKQVDVTAYYTHWPNAASGFVCSSYDVVSHTSHSSVRSVPLHPHHRYHFVVDHQGHGTGSALFFAAERDDVTTIKCGPFCTVCIWLNPSLTVSHPFPLSGRVASGTSLAGDDVTEDTLCCTQPMPLARKRSRATVALPPSSVSTLPSQPPGKCRVAARQSSRRRSVSGTKDSRCRKEAKVNFPEVRTVLSTSKPIEGSHRVIFTTGIRLTAKEEAQCKRLGLLVNPELEEAAKAEVLVIRGPLQRSVKLLSVLPFVEYLVHHRWLDDVIAFNNPTIPCNAYVYAEEPHKESLEVQNNCTLGKLMSIPSKVRCALFRGQSFFVHPAAQPQEPPLNDLRTVISASGGHVCRQAQEATVWVLPSRLPTAAQWRSLTAKLEYRDGVGELDVGTRVLTTPDDLFKCVLRQAELSTSTVSAPLSLSRTTRNSTSRASRRGTTPLHVTSTHQ